MSLLERFSEVFYNPYVFWGVPLAIGVLWAGLRRIRAGARRRR